MREGEALLTFADALLARDKLVAQLKRLRATGGTTGPPRHRREEQQAAAGGEPRQDPIS